MLTEQDLRDYSDLVYEADLKEIQSFVSDKVFKLCQRTSAKQRPMSCLWVRKRKGDEVKARPCVRGFLDPQKRHVSRYSSTATRLSQRLLVSLSVEHHFELEQWDIGNAFLKGFSFKVMREMCPKFGITVPDCARQVFITVPGNVW